MSDSPSATPHDAAARGPAWPSDLAFARALLDREELASEYLALPYYNWVDPGPGNTNVREWWVDPADHTKAMPANAYQWLVNVFPVLMDAIIVATSGTKRVVLQMLDASGTPLSTLELSSVFTVSGTPPLTTRSAPVVTPDGRIVTSFNGLRATADPAGGFDPAFIRVGVAIYFMPFIREFVGNP